MNLSQATKTLYIVTTQDNGETVMVSLIKQSPICRDDEIVAYPIHKISGFDYEFADHPETASDFIKLYKIQGISVRLPSGEIIPPSELENRFQATPIKKTISFDIF